MISRLRSAIGGVLGSPGYCARQLSLDEPLGRRPGDGPATVYRIRPAPADGVVTAAAEFFRSIHDVRTNYRGVNVSEHGTFELWFGAGEIRFSLDAAEGRDRLVRRRLETAFDDPHVERVTRSRAFPAVRPDAAVAGARVRQRRHEYYPIRTHDADGFPVDPYDEVTSAIATPTEGFVVVQVCYRPAKRSWTDASRFGRDGIEDVAHGLRQGTSVGWLHPRIRPASDADERLATRLERRRRRPAFHTIVRVLAVSRDDAAAATRARRVAGTFRQLYDGPGGQGLVDVPIASRSSWRHRRRLRGFLERVADRRWTDDGSILTVDELAGLAHLPSAAVDTRTVDWRQSTAGETVVPGSPAARDGHRAAADRSR